jgi:hypothetical protein
MTKQQKNRLLKAKIAVALHDELGRVPKQEEIEQVFTLTKGAGAEVDALPREGGVDAEGSQPGVLLQVPDGIASGGWLLAVLWRIILGRYDFMTLRSFFNVVTISGRWSKPATRSICRRWLLAKPPSS